MLSRISYLLLIAGLATSPLRAQTDPFVGQWKLVKTTDRMSVTKVGVNTYAFDFGVGPETIVVDGTFQPGYGGTTLSVAADGANWKVVRRKDGRTQIVAIWTLSKDGNSLEDDFTIFGQDGSPSNVKYVYERKAAASGFAGTWVSQTAAINSAILLQIRPYENGGLSFITPSQNVTLNANFDGKEYPDANAGTVSSARRPNANTVEITRKSGGKITQTRQIELSSDLKTLTMTVHVAGIDQPYVYVFERS